MKAITKFLLITIAVIISEFECNDKQSCNSSPNIVELSMIKDGIVPDIIDISPKDKIRVRFASGFDVNLGNELTPLSLKDEPYVTWPIQPNQNYTLILVGADPPASEDPNFRALNHWYVINIPGTDIDKGQIREHYLGAAPPEGAGLHRYLFLVYKQSKYLEYNSPVVPFSIKNSGLRANFFVREIAKKNGLGHPIAGNYFLTQPDQYSKELWIKWIKNEQ